MVESFLARDGVALAYRELGEGRPLVLLHGFTGRGEQWVSAGPADVLAAHGYRVILPDLRGHGDSAAPEDYPPDVLVDDGLALIDHLGLDDYALGGHSIGGRVTVRMLARGARPTHAIVVGQGLRSVSRVPRSPRVLHPVLGSLVPTPVEVLSQLATPTLVVVGDEEPLNADALAATLPHARLARVPGGHMSALAAPELATTMMSFLEERRLTSHL